MLNLGNNFHIVEAQGNDYCRGVAHGKTLKPVIQKIIKTWADHIKNITGLTLEVYASKIKNETLLFKSIQQLAPDLLEEVHGIADGADLPRLIIEAWQYIDEHEWFIKDFIQNKKDISGNACSTLGFKNPDNIILGQNLDIPIYKNGIQTILKFIDGSGKSSIVFTQAGVLASLGANNSPLAICVNSLPQLAYRSDGLPVSYLVRKVLQNNSLADGVEALKTLPHATAQNYLIGSNIKFSNYECSANQTALVEYPEADRMFHTNHILLNNDTRPNMSKEELTLLNLTNKESSLPRYQFLQNKLSRCESLSAIQAKKILATQPLSISLKQDLRQLTFISAVFDLGVESKIWATAGPPEENQYAPVSWLY